MSEFTETQTPQRAARGAGSRTLCFSDQKGTASFSLCTFLAMAPGTKLNHLLPLRCRQDADTQKGPFQHLLLLSCSCSSAAVLHAADPCPPTCRQSRMLLGLINSLRSASPQYKLQEEERHSQQG